MSHAAALRLTYALPLAFSLALVWPEAADAGRYVPLPIRDAPIAAAPAAAPRPLPASGRMPTLGVDAEGRNISMSVPSHVRLYGVARAEQVMLRTVIESTGAGTARLGLARDGAIATPGGAYVGVVEMTVDYN